MRMRGNICLLAFKESGMANSATAAQSSARKATNVSIGEALLVEAKSLRINISQAAEAGLVRAVADKRAELWLEANKDALESSNAYVDQKGLPLARYRGF